MAADWIKMRTDLLSHPKVVRILSATNADKFRAIGGLHVVWSVFDTHTTDGILRGYTPDLMDHIIGWPGFSAAMIDVGWLHYDGQKTLSMPEFIEHNGKSAKRRAEDQKRKRDARRDPEDVRKASAKDADKKRTRDRDRDRDREDIGEGKPSPSASPDDERLASWIFDKVLEAVPGTKPPNLTKWANTIRLMRERDGLAHRQIAELFSWANKHSFWRTNVLSPDKLREKFPQLAAKKNEEESHATRQQPAARSRSEKADQALADYFAEIDASAAQDAGDGVDGAVQPETCD